MKKYLGVKLIEAEPMNLGDYNKFRGWTIPENEDPLKEGYRVVYPDGYVSWSPKDIFEKAYMQVGDNNTITQQIVDNFIACYKDYKLDDKTTVVKATLVNGFEVVESSSCVDPANFDQEVGISICLERIKNKVWMLLGFLLQTGICGVK
jgi:hypothetical protein